MTKLEIDQLVTQLLDHLELSGLRRESWRRTMTITITDSIGAKHPVSTVTQAAWEATRRTKQRMQALQGGSNARKVIKETPKARPE